jgi:hypothetical protein
MPALQHPASPTPTRPTGSLWPALLGTLALIVSPIAADAAGPRQAQSGTIKGRLVWGGPSVPELPLLVKKGDTNVKDAAVCAATDLKDRSLVVDPATKGIAHAFVYLVSPKGTNPEAEASLLKAHPTAVIDQKNCEFLPYCLAMHESQTITFKSSDPIGHNVRYAAFGGSSQNIMLKANGELAGQKIKASRRPIPLNCDIHPWMKGYLMVFDHPYFAVTGADGSFEITGVPAGTQNLVLLMPERVGFVNEGGQKGQPVVVKAGATTDVGTVTLDPARVKK